MNQQVIYVGAPPSCPHCGSENYHFHDPGEILAGIVIFVLGTALAVVANILAESLWHWMTDSWLSLAAIARCALVWVAAVFPLILLLRRPIKRLAGKRRSECASCGYVDMQVRRDPKRGTKIALGILLVPLLVLLGLCASGNVLGIQTSNTIIGAPPAPRTLTGEWVAGDGATYRFTTSDDSTFTGTIVTPAICHPSRIHLTAQGNGSYAGTLDRYDDPCQKIVAEIQLTLQISIDGRTLDLVAKGCDECGAQALTRRS